MDFGKVINPIKLFFEHLRLTQQYYKNVYPYKLVEIVKCNKDGHIQLHVQVTWKNTFLVFTPLALLKDENILHRFAPGDIKQIIMAAFEEKQPATIIEKTPHYRVVSHYYSKDAKKEMIQLFCENKGETIVKSAQEISCDKKLLKMLHPLDANRVGYSAGYENALDK